MAINRFNMDFCNIARFDCKCGRRYINTSKCNQCTYSNEKQTNADRIRSMSDEELAEFLNKFEFCNGYAKGYCNATNCKECAGNNDDTLEWLKSEEISK